ESRFDTIIILASSHRCAFHGASIDQCSAFQTPLGTVPVNLVLARKLMSEHPGLFSFRDEAHSAEHSVEVQLPFLQHRLKHPFHILPIVIGSQDKEQCRALAEALRPLFVPENLFVVSTDFSHYPPGDEAHKVDARTADAIAKNDPEALVDVLTQNRRMNIPGLATSLCGWSSVLCLLHLSREIADGSYHLLKYQHSGEKAYRDKKEVVGYWAIAFTGPSKTGDDATFHLSREEKDALLMIARHTLEMELSDKDWTPERDALPSALLEARGVFVSLKNQGRLRGCIGRFDAKAPLYLSVQQMAIAAATRDTRFKAVTSEELNEINIEISVLGPLRKV
ncbi:MAG: AmmeMemoRadiSam system protein B, partial [Bacteroidales bacterium]|nr:AmmeMemoRadiSam system protein B [Bacteroidales bacterium]